MSLKAARKARASNRNQKRAQAHAQKRGETESTPIAKPANDRDKTGLEWLVHKKRITTRQAIAGRTYGEDFRAAQAHGVVPLRSCLNDSPGGSAGSRTLPAVEFHLEAIDRVAAAQAALCWQEDMLAALNAVCARQMTPWQVIELAGGSARDVSRLEAVIVVALDLLDKHYRSV